MPRKSITPPPLDDIEEKVKSDMRAFDDFDVVNRKRVELIIRDRIRNLQDRDYYKTKAEALCYDKQQLEAQCACQEFQLDGRGTIEYCESQIFPNWIKNIKMERYQQWALSLDFELTPMARTLRKKIPAVLSGHDVGKIVDSFYNTWAIKYTHKRKIRPPTTDDMWALIFKSLDVSQAEEKSVLKSIILMNVLEAEPLDGGENTTSGYMIIDNVSWFVTREKIIDFCTEEGVQVLKLSFILDDSDRKTSKIGIFVSDIHVARKMLPNVPNHLHAPGRKWEEIISVLQNEI